VRRICDLDGEVRNFVSVHVALDDLADRTPEGVQLAGRAGERNVGEGNGQYRQGDRTKAAIAEPRKFSALLKMLRAGLT
jgi:hypothetical protein